MAAESRWSAGTERERFFTHAIDLLCIAGMNGCIKDANPSFACTLGYSESELHGRSLIEFVHAQDESGMLELMSKLADGMAATDVECRFRHRDGTYRWLAWNIQPSTDSGHIFAVGRDVTERKQTEKKLRDSTDWYQMVLNSIDESFCVIEMVFDDEDAPVDYRFLSTNRVFEEQTGLVGATGKSMRSLAPDHEEHWFEIYGRIALTGEPERFEAPAAALDRYFDVYAFRVGEPEQRRVAILFNDITDRRRAEDALRESEQRFREALEIETVGVIFLDLDGQITDANDAFLRMGGYSREDLESGRLRWDDLTPPEWIPASHHSIMEVETIGYTTPYEKEYYRKDGSRWWALFAAKMVDHTTAIEYVLDITERKRTEEERERLRQQAEAALRARDEFLSIASHELRNPVASIKVAAQIMRRALDQDGASIDKLNHLTRTIELTSDHLSVLIDDLLDVSRLESGRFPLYKQTVDLAQLARDAIELLPVAAERHIIQPDVEGSVELSIDPERVRQVIVNLLDNAVKYSPEGREIRLHLTVSDGGALLSVQDYGIGIEPSSLERVFEPFGRASNATENRIPGMGLGLYICRRIAEAHGGRLWAESDGEGTGTVMCLWLPREHQGNGESSASDADQGA